MVGSPGSPQQPMALRVVHLLPGAHPGSQPGSASPDRPRTNRSVATSAASRQTMGIKTVEAINRLTTTRAHLGGQLEGFYDMARQPAPTAAQLERLLLTRAQFGEALRRVAVA
ncbi:hypothetical protein HaLaN_28279, partial [Haematococcus lacustris]